MLKYTRYFAKNTNANTRFAINQVLFLLCTHIYFLPISALTIILLPLIEARVSLGESTHEIFGTTSTMI